MNDLIDYFKARRLGVISDDSSAKERGVIFAPAQAMTSSCVNEILSITGATLCVALSPERCSQFMLAKMARPQTRPPSTVEHGLNFCVSVDAREGITTGISAADRAKAIAVLGETLPNPRKLVRPGHIFPIETCVGGVLERNALAEASLDIVKLAGFSDAALMVELLDSQGKILSKQELKNLALKLKLPHFSLGDLVKHRLETEQLVQRFAEAKLPTRFGGEFRSYIYKSSLHGGEHFALIKGSVSSSDPVLTRVQTEFTFADVFGGSNPPTRTLIEQSLRMIGARGSGVFVYLRKSRQGVLREQVLEWNTAFSSKPAQMMREYGLGAQILRDLGVSKVELITNSSRNLVGLKSFGIEIVSQVPFVGTQQL